MCLMPFDHAAHSAIQQNYVLATESNGISLAKDMCMCVCVSMYAIAIALFMTLMSNDLMFRIE